LILVFGAGGQLGQELIARSRERGVLLTGLTRQQTDILEAAAVDRAIEQSRPSLVVNAASYNFVDKAESEPDAAMRINAAGPSILAQACAKAGLPLVHISTDYVFDGGKADAYSENDQAAPLNVYGLTKKAGEDAVRDACPEHLILRTAWLFGAYGSNFLKTVLRLAAEKTELSFVSDQRGSPTSTADLVEAILVVAAALAKGASPWGTYHVAGKAPASRYEFASHIAAAQALFTGHTPRVKPILAADYRAAARRPAHSVLDSTKFAKAFGFQAADWRSEVQRVLPQIFSATVRA
jgi:dTDP-4-dehydrorhamnose reductase